MVLIFIWSILFHNNELGNYPSYTLSFMLQSFQGKQSWEFKIPQIGTGLESTLGQGVGKKWTGNFFSSPDEHNSNVIIDIIDKLCIDE